MWLPVPLIRQIDQIQSKTDGQIQIIEMVDLIWMQQIWDS